MGLSKLRGSILLQAVFASGSEGLHLAPKDTSGTLTVLCQTLVRSGPRGAKALLDPKPNSKATSTAP